MGLEAGARANPSCASCCASCPALAVDLAEASSCRRADLGLGRGAARAPREESARAEGGERERPASQKRALEMENACGLAVEIESESESVGEAVSESESVGEVDSLCSTISNMDEHYDTLVVKLATHCSVSALSNDLQQPFRDCCVGIATQSLGVSPNSGGHGSDRDDERRRALATTFETRVSPNVYDQHLPLRGWCFCATQSLGPSPGGRRMRVRGRQTELEDLFGAGACCGGRCRVRRSSRPSTDHRYATQSRTAGPSRLLARPLSRRRSK